MSLWECLAIIMASLSDLVKSLVCVSAFLLFRKSTQRSHLVTRRHLTLESPFLFAYFISPSKIQLVDILELQIYRVDLSGCAFLCKPQHICIHLQSRLYQVGLGLKSRAVVWYHSYPATFQHCLTVLNRSKGLGSFHAKLVDTLVILHNRRFLTWSHAGCILAVVSLLISKSNTARARNILFVIP